MKTKIIMGVMMALLAMNIVPLATSQNGSGEGGERNRTNNPGEDWITVEANNCKYNCTIEKGTSARNQPYAWCTCMRYPKSQAYLGELVESVGGGRKR